MGNHIISTVLLLCNQVKYIATNPCKRASIINYEYVLFLLPVFWFIIAMLCIIFTASILVYNCYALLYVIATKIINILDRRRNLKH